jgi:signal transduction histidine kinase
MSHDGETTNQSAQPPVDPPHQLPEKHRRLLSSFRLKTILTTFLVCLLAAVTVLTVSLVTRIFHRFDAAVRSDLEWKAVRGANEVAHSIDVGMALADPAMVIEDMGEYRQSPDVLAIVAVDPSGDTIAHFGSVLPPWQIAQLFRTASGVVHAADGYVWSWAAAHIEGKMVGQVAVLISLRRLQEGAALRRSILKFTGVGCVVALFVSLFFVNFYLGPLLRFTEATLANLKDLNASLEERVSDRTVALSKSLDTLLTTQRQLADASHRAGKAEVATTVLHNVGNVLNSVNVSCNLLMERTRKTKIDDLGKLATLLRENHAELGPFFVTHAKGRKFIDYLALIAKVAVTHQQGMLSELVGVQRNIDHIKTIVSQQQTNAKTLVSVVETIPVGDLLDEAIQINGLSFDRHEVTVTREYEDLPPAKVDRHKMLQIVMNLLSNARQALKTTGADQRRIAVRVQRAGAERFRVLVDDSGCGIAPDNLSRIFSYGFTTKTEGHGFGLHSAACAALEMGGTLTAQSDGPGRGACFTLDLPIDTSTRHNNPAAA